MEEMKKISDSYMYGVINYGKNIFDFLMSAERVDTKSDAFADVIYAVKKQANTLLLKVLLSEKVVLLMHPKGVSRAFKVIYCKDIKEKRTKRRVFIDCTGVISFENGVYTCKKVGTLVSYLTTAMTYIMYYEKPNAIINNNTLTKTGVNIFVDLMLYVLGYLKAPISFNDNKEKMSFVLAEYYQLCILGADSRSETPFNIAKQISGITAKNTCDYLHTLFSFTFDDGKCNFNDFLKKFAEVFLDQKEDDGRPAKNKLTVDSFSQRWMYAYGPGTILGLECFVPFSQIVTDCANGAYLNQQNTIEKVAGAKNITSFYNELLKVGSENA